LFGRVNKGHYFVYHGSRYRRAGFIEVTQTKYLVCEVANWVLIALVLCAIATKLRSSYRSGTSNDVDA
jgi:uncharacterized membrane protein (GlpM family)